LTEPKARERESGRAGERESGRGADPLPAELRNDEIEVEDFVSPTLPLSHSLTLPLSAPAETEDQRLDLFLVSQSSGASRSAIQRAINGGDITVNGKAVKPSHRLSAGEKIEGEIPESPPIEAVPENIPLDIIYEDDEIIVINKPAGMVTHPGAGVVSGTLANGLVYHFNRISHQPPRRGGVSRPGIVHRLDVGTSGLIVAAKTDRAHLSLAGQFESRTVLKSYTALVYGIVKEDAGRIEAPIGRDLRSRVKMAVAREGQGRNALTLYRVVKRFDEFTLLDVEIKTGRTHQIRVHLAHLKHPVVADSTYEAGRANTIKNARLRAAITKLDRPFLHAARLGFAHPTSEEKMEFTAPLPADLQSLLDAISGAKAY